MEQGRVIPNEPPWEWIHGDRARVAQFRLIVGVSLGAGILVLASTILNILGMAGAWSGPAVPFWVGSPVVALLFLVGGFFLLGFERRYPIVSQLGISPVGIRMVLPFHNKLAANWGEVKWVGPDWVEVDRGHGSRRYKLTADQIHRLARFTQPLPTGLEGSPH
ncbi:MAG: hypothetical protein WAN87_09000 [Thermoplasmata archaeon]